MTAREYSMAQQLLTISNKAMKNIEEYIDIDGISMNDYMAIGLDTILTGIDTILEDFPELEDKLKEIIQGK